ncbi:hypothetical protein BDD12DRAFT_16341 [Trichophaea hybrida]|nr:hypothetical protein BDD12DRAFT_16341 [Trichophaea hybrida]
MFKFLTPAATLASTAPPALTTSLAPMSSIFPTAPPESQAFPASPAPATPMDLMTPTTTPASMASTTPMAPTTSLPSFSAPTMSPASPISLAPILSPALTAPVLLMTSGTPTTSLAPTAPTAFTPPARTHTARQGTIRAGPTVQLGIIRVEPPQGQKIRRHCYAHPEPAKPHRSESTVTCRSEPAPSNCQKPGQPQRAPEAIQSHGQEPAPPNRQEPVKLPRSKPIVPSHNQPVPPNRQEPTPPCEYPVQLPQRDVPPCYYCGNDQHNLRKCADLSTDLEKGIVNINNRDRLVLGTAGGEIPMAPAARDFPPPPPPPPPAQSPPPPRTSTPLPSPEQLTQLMREVTEHFAQSLRYEVVVQDPPPPPPAQLSRTSVPLPSPEKLTQLVQEVTEHFAQPRPRQTARPPPSARKAQILEQQRSICV